MDKTNGAGWIWCEGGEIVGMASDGIVVNFGSLPMLGAKAFLPFDAGFLSYLAANPTPDMW